MRHALIALAVLLLPASAASHHEHQPKQDFLTFTEQRAFLLVTYVYPAGKEASGFRKLFDLDRNGKLDPRELRRAQGYIKKLSTSFLQIRLNGKRLKFKVVDKKFFGLDEPTRSQSRITARLRIYTKKPKLIPGENELVFADRLKDPSIGIPAKVKIFDGPETEQTLDKTNPEIRLKFQWP